MEADSFFDEMEPRMLRPVLPFLDRQVQLTTVHYCYFLPDADSRFCLVLQQMVFDRVQVSEPSLFQEDEASPFLRRDTAPRMQARQLSPIKNPVFCRSLDETPRFFSFTTFSLWFTLTIFSLWYTGWCDKASNNLPVAARLVVAHHH